MDGPQVEGALNFRDVGGMACGPDRRVRHGVLFRSDTLQFLTPDDVHLLVRERGLRSDIDLRLAYEVQVEGRGPLEDEPTVEHHHLPLVVAGSVVKGEATPILQQTDPMVAHYVGYLGSSAESFRDMVKVLARPEGTPAVIHCAAGKDRTGVAVAVVLAAIGCSQSDIAAEYAVGSHLIPAVFDRLRGMESYGASIDKLPPEANLTSADYILRFFERVQETYGGVVAYLHSQGVTDDELAALHEVLTEPSPPVTADPAPA